MTQEEIKKYLDHVSLQIKLNKQWYQEDIGSKSAKTVKAFETKSSENQRKVYDFEKKLELEMENILKDSEIESELKIKLIISRLQKAKYNEVVKFATINYGLVLDAFNRLATTKTMAGEIAFLFGTKEADTYASTTEKEFVLLAKAIFKVNTYWNIPGIVKKPDVFRAFAQNDLIVKRAMASVESCKWRSPNNSTMLSLFLFWACIYILLLSGKSEAMKKISTWINSKMNRDEVYLLNQFLNHNKKEAAIAKIYEEFSKRYSLVWREEYSE